jgi:hypothetical protein
MYFLALYAVFKNESHIFKEWLEHYIREGVEHFYLIDNGSDDNYKEVIKPYMDKITLFYDTGDYSGKYSKQASLYQKHIFPKFIETKWILCVDLDEFMYTKNGTIASELTKKEYSDVGQIMVPWKMFGSSGHINQPYSVIKSFLYRKKLSFHCFGNYKTICRTEAIEDINGVHWYDNIKQGFRTIKYKDQNEMTEEEQHKLPFQLNHYIVQSWDWFKNTKMTRGDSNFETNSRDEKYFNQWDCNDVLDDELSIKTNNPNLSILLFILLVFINGFDIITWIIAFLSMLL